MIFTINYRDQYLWWCYLAIPLMIWFSKYWFSIITSPRGQGIMFVKQFYFHFFSDINNYILLFQFWTLHELMFDCSTVSLLLWMLSSLFFLYLFVYIYVCIPINCIETRSYQIRTRIKIIKFQWNRIFHPLVLWFETLNIISYFLWW